jgi:hypothetical protein
MAEDCRASQRINFEGRVKIVKQLQYDIALWRTVANFGGGPFS